MICGILTVCAEAITKVLIDDGNNEKALRIYDDQKLHNNITHLLAIKACMNTDNFEKGLSIHRNIKFDKMSDDSKSNLMCVLIEFFCKFGKSDAAEKLY